MENGMNKKIILPFIIIAFMTLNIAAADKTLKFTITVPDKSSPSLTNAVIAADINDVCCAYFYGMIYIVEDDGTVKVITDNTFSQAEAGVETSPIKNATIGRKSCSTCKISVKYDRNDVSAEKVQGKASGIQSGKVLKEAMIAAIKKTKQYKKVKKSKKGFSGSIYPNNNLNLKIGASNVSITETFSITVQ